MNLYDISEMGERRQVVGARSPPGSREEIMSLILRIFLVLAGFITALFVARDSLKFDILQMFVAILLVTGVLLVGSLWSLWRRQA